VLLCCCVVVLLCYCVVVLLCCCVVVLLCCCVVVLLCCCVVVLLCCCVTVLLCCTSDRRSESLSLNLDQICVSMSVCPSVPMQITLGVLCTILPVRQIIGYFGKFGYFVQPHECSHTYVLIT
jgi:hypothetical protein